MKTLIQSCTVFVIYLLLSSHALAWSPFGPKTYEDCILQGMKGVTSDVAARTIQAACSEKFPNTSTRESRLIRDCTITYSGGTFVSGRPLELAKYFAVRFPNSTSLVYLPETMKHGKRARQLIVENKSIIREICPDIKIEID